MRSAAKISRTKQRPVAQRLRRDSTDAETAFWLRVRDRRFMGLKFKRQVPIGRYIVDFLCPEHALVVEIDGGQHNGSQRDKVRDAFLATQNLSVVRFWNNDVLSNTNGVLTQLTEIIGSLSPIRNADGGRGRGVRGRLRKSDRDDCCAAPSSQPSPSTRLRRAGEKEPKGLTMLERLNKSSGVDCCATPSSQPSPAMRLRRTGEKEQKGKVVR